MEKQETQPVPPGRHIGLAECHWLERIDYDGRPCGLEVYQWQPGARQWCRPNEYAQNRNVDLTGYRYVAVCPTPPSEEELKAVESVMLQLKRNYIARDPAEFETFKRLVHEHLYTLPRMR